MKPQNFEEKVIWYAIVWTYPLYFIGIQPLLGPLIAWGLGLYAGAKLWLQTDETPEEEKIRVPITAWVWIAGICLLEIALIQGHFDYNLEHRILTSTVGIVVKGWALLALYPLIGSCLKIRPQLLFRACCIFCAQSLFLAIICTLAGRLNIALPEYTSPFARLGGVGWVALAQGAGAGEEYRVQLFAPWPPALGLVGSVYLGLTYGEPSHRWKWIGIAGAVMMIWASASRTGQVCLTAVPLLTFLLSNISRPTMQITTGVGGFLAGVFGPQVYLYFRDLSRSINQQRAGASEGRRLIFEISLFRWRTEAFVWGHGTSVIGPAVTTYKPLGSHNTWAGLLFAHGIVGAIAFAIPMAWTTIELFIKSQSSRVAQAGLAVVIALLFYTASENLDFLAYLYWPGLLLMGMGFREKLPTPSLLERI